MRRVLMSRSRLLFIDAVINLILGVLLLTFLSFVVDFLGVPKVENPFYARILGGVLFGIGIALLYESKIKKGTRTGLGLLGAVTINICAGITLAGLLLFGQFQMSLRGKIFLWILVFILLTISLFEVVVQKNRKTG